MLFMAEGDHAYALGLSHAAEVGDRNAGYAVDRLHTIELQCVNDEIEPISQFTLVFRSLLIR